MQSPTSKDKGLIGMPLHIGTPGGIQSENPSCIRVSGNVRASSEHPPSILQVSSEKIPRSYQGCPEVHVSPCASFPVSSYVSSIVSPLVPRLSSHHVSRNHLIVTDYSECAESQDLRNIWNPCNPRMLRKIRNMRNVNNIQIIRNIQSIRNILNS